MLLFGKRFARALLDGCVITLQGNLGAGKTTLARGILQGLGHQGVVKSPTFTIVEPYQVNARKIYHFDLYRLADPEELEYLGIRDYFSADSITLIEWPEQGRGVIPQADVAIQIEYQDKARCLNLVGNTDKGKQILSELA